MTISFPNAPHVATLWLPQLQPTRATVISTVLGLALCALFATAAVVLFMVYCLEQRFSALRTVLTFVVLVAVIGVCGGGLQHITGTNVIKDPWPSAQRSAAVENARKAAHPADGWTAHAKAVSADGRITQEGWTADDRRAISSAVEKQEHLTSVTSLPEATIDTTHMSEALIAQHGTTYLKNGRPTRCVVEVGDVHKNNVGQPLSATLKSVRCAAPTAA